MKHAERLFVFVMLLTGSASTALAEPRCKRPIESSEIQLPKDDAVHATTPESFEWFYWTSHLEASDGRKFGFLDIIYSTRAEIEPGQVVPIHYSDTTIADLNDNTYHYGGRAFNYSPAPILPNRFDFAVGDNAVTGGDGSDHLHAVVKDSERSYIVDLWLFSLKPAVEQIAEDYLHEYARTRMLSVGTIEVDGESVRVFGYSVFDHAFGDMQPQLAQVDNWTWMSIQLQDGRELVLLKAIRKNGSTMEYVNLTDAQCRVQRFGPGEFSLTPKASWSPSPECSYPMGWKLSVPSARIDLDIAPAMLDQDILVPGMDHYYEGEVLVTGAVKEPVSGRGVVELTWFCSW